MWQQIVRWTQILLLATIMCAVEGNAQVENVQCYLERRNCAGTFHLFTLDQCRTLVDGLSYNDSVTRECINFPISFGFEQTSLVGLEQTDEYSVNMGFLEGALDQDLTVTVEIILGTARSSDFNLITSTITRTFPARISSIQPVSFTLVLDLIAQELNETFTLRLDYNRSLFEPDDNVEFFDELNVTIVDVYTDQMIDIVIYVVVVLVIVGFLFLLGIALLYGILAMNKKFKRSSLNQNISSELPKDIDLDTTTMQVRRTLRVKVPKHLIVNSSDLQLVESVGQGEYGIVYRAKLSKGFNKSFTEIVAVKTLKGFMDDTLVRSLLEECTKMSTFDHSNVLAVSGVCVDGGPAPYIIMPFMFNGSLLSYLKKKREELVLSSDLGAETLAVSAKLTNICFQVAKGMEYLSGCKVVHRDLAARNCMIDLNFVVKVADFGLSETIDPSKDYFRQDNTEGMKLPVKWLAPECFSDGIFSEKSDVWAFGVTCWEVFSGGMMPYSGINPADLPHMLEAGYRMEKPSNWACQDNMYDDIMFRCWANKVERRPTFHELVTVLSQHLESLSDYTQLSA